MNSPGSAGTIFVVHPGLHFVVELVIRNNQFYQPIISAYMCYLPNEEKRLRRWANSMGRIAITATQNGLILEAANPISLCVEFLALWRGNIRPGVGKVPRRERCTNGAVKMTPLSGYVGY